MKTIKCPADRQQKVRGHGVIKLKCARRFISLDETINQQLIVQCQGCRTIWKIDIMAKKAYLKTIQSKTVDFGEEIPSTVEGYAVKF